MTFCLFDSQFFPQIKSLTKLLFNSRLTSLFTDDNLLLYLRTIFPPHFHSSSSAQRDEDNNSVRMYLRGRPINVYVPESKADSYEITKVQPAPSKKLKLDWVCLLLFIINYILINTIFLLFF